MVDANLADAVGRMTTGVTRYLVTIGVDEVTGRMTKTASLEEGRTAPRIDPGESAPFPSLDEAPIGATLGESLLSDEDRVPAVPTDLFAGVVGLEYERAVLRHCLSGEWSPRKHALVYGAPGSAKSFLLEQIRSLPETRYITEFSRAELRRIVSEQMDGTGVLLIDEIDKADRDAQDALLVIMDGNLAPAIHGQSQERHVEIRVIGAANFPERLTDPLRSRFNALPLPEYGVEQRKAVMTAILEKRPGMTPADAAEIAGLVAPHSADVREAERIAEARASDPELAAQMANRLGAGHAGVAPRKAPKPVPSP
jgi:hypothetical protein